MIRLSLFTALALLLAVLASCSTGKHPREQGIGPGIIPDPSQVAPSAAARAPMPPPPKTAGPEKASPTGADEERPPHPAIPAPLREPQPTVETLASTDYRWLPGHWLWTGNQYEWQSGVWVHEVPGYELVPPRWTWNGYEWSFVNAGWAVPGTSRVLYRPTVVRTDIPTEPGFAERAAPAPNPGATEPDVYQEASSYAVYSWPGYWVAPAIIYPVWHPYYHYYWHHHHRPHARPPLCRDGRYDFAMQHELSPEAQVEYQRRTWARANHRPGGQPEAMPVIPDTLPDTVRIRALRAEHLDPVELRSPGRLDPDALQATPAQRALRQRAESSPVSYGLPRSAAFGTQRAASTAADPQRPPPSTPRYRASQPTATPSTTVQDASGSRRVPPAIRSGSVSGAGSSLPRSAPLPRVTPGGPAAPSALPPRVTASGRLRTSRPSSAAATSVSRPAANAPSPRATPTSRAVPGSAPPRATPSTPPRPSLRIQRVPGQ